MKRSLTAVAAAGFLTFGLAACGGEEDTESPDAPAEQDTGADDGAGAEDTAAPPAEGEETAEPPADGAETGAPGDGEQTGAPGDTGTGTGAPGDGEQTGAAPDPEAAEWCQSLAELGQDADFNASMSDPAQSVELFEQLREGAPEAVAGDLDILIEAMGSIDPEDPASVEGLDIQAIQDAGTNFSEYVTTNCGPAL